MFQVAMNNIIEHTSDLIKDSMEAIEDHLMALVRTLNRVLTCAQQLRRQLKTFKSYLP